MTKKKEREQYQLKVFWEKFGDFPEGEVDGSGENPDFLVQTEYGNLGIEITTLNHMDMKAQESEESKCLEYASKMYEKTNLLPLQVDVIFDATRITKEMRFKIGGSLAKIVARYLPPLGTRCRVDNDDDLIDDWPEAIQTIFMVTSSFITRNCWSAVSTGPFSVDFSEVLQKTINEKNERLNDYKKKCERCWLLIVTNIEGPSSFFDPSNETLAYEYQAEFDRIFLLNEFSRTYNELAINKNI